MRMKIYKISLRTITTHPYGYSICVTLWIVNILIKSFGTFLFWIQTRDQIARNSSGHRKDFLKVSTFLVQRLIFFREFWYYTYIYTTVPSTK